MNQAEVMRRADLVIHHGGAGTMLGALAQGLPQLVLPEGADRPFTSGRLRDAGAAIVVPPAEATPGVVAEAVETLLRDPAFRASAEHVRADIESMPSPARLVPRLEGLARRLST